MKRLTPWLVVLGLLAIACGVGIGWGLALFARQVASPATQTALAQTVFAQPQLTVTPEAPDPAQPSSTPSLLPVQPTQVYVDTPALAQGIETVDERLLKSARILLFENMSASRKYRFVKEALDQAGYFYLDVGSAKGWFKTQLLSSVDWDLVIAAAENRRDYNGEMGELFEYLAQRIQGGSAAIVEFGDFDYAPQGKSKSILDACGLEFQDDWFEPEQRTVLWLLPTHPVLNQPFPFPERLRNTMPLYQGDIGDLLTPIQQAGQPASDAILLADDTPDGMTGSGLLAICLGGRMIVQTFSSHEYWREDMVPLWVNYIYQALKGRFAASPRALPAPPVTASPGVATAAVPGNPAVGKAFPCGDLLSASIIESPRFTSILFEHIPQGQFVTLTLALFNSSGFPIQVWDGDYSIEGFLQGQPVVYPLHHAATGYLYIDSPTSTNLWQDIIQPGATWRARLAFDVDPRGSGWTLLLRPGSEFNQAACEVRVPLP